ncbi:LPS export ABC transporter permease LptF [Pelagibaculum spongiae]|uniref:Lipopolysaccharide export system permease protein LptF n=1 Tax=Pelagibaculum spongiae TaxID=2080658 RepID=A0A2V1GTQ8_9GAMM|nr:LPS export ABC transporter permease LptF [Pelagibaculum spongiae]PVZ65452.1 LPS export ABC transporter permease LptF [Pelagibaculum spongiae]
MKLIQRYLLLEILQTLAALTMVLMMIFVSGRFASYLGKVAAGEMDGQLVVSLLAFKVPGYLAAVLPIAMFLAVLLALGRLYADSEMAALRACGLSDRQLLTSVGLSSIPAVVICFMLTFYAKPWAENAEEYLLAENSAQLPLANMESSSFLEPAPGQAFFAETISGDQKNFGDVFIADLSDPNAPSIVMAPKASWQQSKAGDSYLSLENGNAWQGVVGQSDWLITRYQQYGIWLDAPLDAGADLSVEGMNVNQLLSSHTNEATAEFQWRIAQPLSLLLLALLAIPLSEIRPRQGRFARMFPAILVYIVYSNILSVAQVAVEEGQIAAWPGMGWAFLLLLLFISWSWRKSMGRMFSKQLPHAVTGANS